MYTDQFDYLDIILPIENQEDAQALQDVINEFTEDAK